NHGGAADDVQRLPGVVSLPSPASRYLVALGRAVALERPGARVHVAVAPGAFARLAREGLEREAGALGLSLVDEPDTADAVLLCGPIEWEAGELRRLRPSGQALIGAVSAGLVPGSDPDAWPGATLAPVQWHPDLPSAPELGPARPNVENYVAAQAYAAAVLATHCRTLDAARGLRTTTFFGGFALAPDGLQVGHRLAVVRRRGRRTEVVLAGLVRRVEVRRDGALRERRRVDRHLVDRSVELRVLDGVEPAADEERARRRRVERQRRARRLLGERLAVRVSGPLGPVVGHDEVVPLAVVEVLRAGREEDLAEVDVDHDLVRRDRHPERPAPRGGAVADDGLPGRVRAPVPGLDRPSRVAARQERRRRE